MPQKTKQKQKTKTKTKTKRNQTKRNKNKQTNKQNIEIMTRQVLFHQQFEHVKIIGVFDLIWKCIPVVDGSIIKGKFSLALGIWNNKVKRTTPGAKMQLILGRKVMKIFLKHG